MSELMSAEEARRKSDVEKDKAIAREIDRIKCLIEIATGAGEYYISLPDGAIPHNETINLLQSKGYRCQFIGDSSVIISWREAK